MAVNHDQKVEVVRRNIAFIQQSIAAGGLATVAGYLLQFELITRQNHDDALAPCGRGPSDQAAMLMRTVELKIRSNPDLYFPRFTQALRWSNLSNVADLLEQQALPDHQRVPGRPAYTLYDSITSNIPSPSDSTQTTATSHDNFSSFSNQPSSCYPIPPNPLPYNPFPPYIPPVQLPVLPPSYRIPSSSYPHILPSSYPYTLQQGNDPTHAHAPSDFPFPLPPNLNQQYSVLPSHTNTPILHQNPLPSRFSRSNSQGRFSHSNSDVLSHGYPYHHLLSSQLYSSTDPNSVTTDAATATSHHSLNPPDEHSLTGPVSRVTTSENTPMHTQSDSTRHSSSFPYHTEQLQSSYQQLFPSDHPRQSYTSNCDSAIYAHHSLLPPSPLAIAPAGVTSQEHFLHQHNSKSPFFKHPTAPPSLSTPGISALVTVHSPTPPSMILSPQADQSSSITVSPNGSDPSEIHKENSRIVWQHIKQQGKLNSVCSLKMLFCGPPETGKTTAMHRLTNQIRCLDPNSPTVDSTVLDKPRTVQLIHKSSVLIADNESWNFDESVKEQGHSIYSLIINSSHGSTTTATGSTPHIATADEGDVNVSARTASEQEAMVASSIEEVTRLAQAEEWEEVAKKLSGIKDITILHVIDSGGQPECHEILPLLLDGQVLSLIFLDLSKNLNDKHAVSFRSSNRYAAAHSEKFPSSEFTTQEVLHHILTSIMSLQSVNDGSCNSIALLVGTHLDKVSSMQVRGLDLKLQDAFKHFIDRGLLCSTDTGDDEEESYIATLNNMTDDQEDIDRLRKLILEVINDHFRKHQEQGIPTGWLLLHLLLRDKYQDQGWCSMADCIATAKLCGIKEEDVCEVLDAIHKNYGTLLFYPSVIDYVICDPNVIISPLKSVFEFVFACSIRTKRAIARSIRDTGEITEKQLMECFEASSRMHLPSSCLIALFRHRYILCEIIHSAGSQKMFFMPCLLKTDANAINHRERHLSSPAPILFVAWSQVYRCYNSPTPLGLFPAVAVDLSGTWNCTMCKVRFRNRIQFDVKDKESGATFTVELCKYATYIELCLKRCPNTGKILTSLREQVLDSLQHVSEKYTHMKPIKWELGFYCPSSLEEGGNPHPAVLNRVENSPIVDMTCCLCSHERVVDLEEKHKCWLVKNDHSANTTARIMQKIQQDDKPTILALDDMKNKDGTSLCIIDTIAAHSNTNFGLHLLDDCNGHIVSTIKKDKNNDCREVTMEILKRWIDAGGSNCTYKFLMDCLRKIGLGGLAEDINSNLMQPAESSSN